MKGRFFVLKEKEYVNVNPDGDDTFPAATPGVNTPEIVVPAYNPPVPNRAWTAMKQGKDIDELSDEEKRMLYYGRDGII